MENKKKFSLIRVIITVAVLVILFMIVFPYIINKYKEEKKNDFLNEVKDIFKTSEQQWVNDSMKIANDIVYSKDIYNKCTNQLELKNNKETLYYINIDRNGNVIEFYVGNGIYQYRYQGDGLKLENITEVETISEVGDRNKVGISCDLVLVGGKVTQKIAFFDVGSKINEMMKKLAGDTIDDSAVKIKDTNIISIKKSSIEPNAANKTIEHIVSAYSSYYPIYMWYEDGTIYWWSEDDNPSLNPNSRSMFALMTNLIDISGLESFETSKVTDMSYMFAGSTGIQMKLKDLMPLRNWNTSHVVDMTSMFQCNSYIESLSGLEAWDTSSVTSMRLMFASERDFPRPTKSIQELKNWNTSNVEDMTAMFQNNNELTTLSGLENWSTSNVRTMMGLFSNCTNLSNINALSSWDTSKVENMDNMFYHNKISSLKALNSWNTSNLTTMGTMFKNCFNIKSLAGLERWDVSNVKNFSEGNDTHNLHREGAFENLLALDDASAINNWNINSDAFFNYMFSGTPTHPEFNKVKGEWDSEGTFVPN